MKKKRIFIGAMGAAGAYLLAISPRLAGRPERMPKVWYAHRGLHDNISDAPENTLAAFQKAVEAGFGIELDVQLTADGQVVVAHDFRLGRICGVAGDVDDYTYEQLQAFPVYDSRERIPLLADVLRLVEGRVPLIIELKYKNGQSKICEKTQEVLNGYRGYYCVESFHPQVLFWYKKHAPQICRGQLSMNFRRDNHDRGLLLWGARHLLANFLTRPDFVAYDCRAMRAVSKNIDRLLFRCPSVAWTVTCQAQLDACRPYYDYFIIEGFIPKE